MFARDLGYNQLLISEMISIALYAIVLEELRDIIKQVVVKARLGDLTAAKLVLGYVVGKPVARLVPVQEVTDEEVSRAVDELLEFHEGRTLEGISLRVRQLADRALELADRAVSTDATPAALLSADTVFYRSHASDGPRGGRLRAQKVNPGVESPIGGQLEHEKWQPIR